MILPPLRSPFLPALRSPFDVANAIRGATTLTERVRRALFSNGEQGGMWDATDMATLFQDSAGATPVTALTQPIGRMLDISGNGNHLLQATAGARPQYTTDGALFDGVNDGMETGSINFGTDDMFVGSVQNRPDTVARMICELSNNATNTAGGFYLVSGLDVVSYYSSLSRGSTISNPNQIAKWTPDNGAETAIITATHSISGDLSTLRRNGVAGTKGTSDKGSGTFGNYPLYVGARMGTSSFFNGSISRLIVVGRPMTMAEIELAEAWLDEPVGVL